MQKLEKNIKLFNILLVFTVLLKNHLIINIFNLFKLYNYIFYYLKLRHKVSYILFFDYHKKKYTFKFKKLTYFNFDKYENFMPIKLLNTSKCLNDNYITKNYWINFYKTNFFKFFDYFLINYVLSLCLLADTYNNYKKFFNLKTVVKTKLFHFKLYFPKKNKRRLKRKREVTVYYWFHIIKKFIASCKYHEKKGHKDFFNKNNIMNFTLKHLKVFTYTKHVLINKNFYYLIKQYNEFFFEFFTRYWHKLNVLFFIRVLNFFEIFIKIKIKFDVLYSNFYSIIFIKRKANGKIHLTVTNKIGEVYFSISSGMVKFTDDKKRSFTEIINGLGLLFEEEIKKKEIYNIKKIFITDLKSKGSMCLQAVLWRVFLSLDKLFRNRIENIDDIRFNFKYPHSSIKGLRKKKLRRI